MLKFVQSLCQHVSSTYSIRWSWIIDQFCAADPNKPHAATHKTGYCDVHHAEYERIHRRWKSARNNFRRGASPHEPKPFPEYLASVGFSHVPAALIPVDESTLGRLEMTAQELTRSLKVITKVLADPHESLYRPQDWAAAGSVHVEAVRDVIELLNDLKESAS